MISCPGSKLKILLLEIDIDMLAFSHTLAPSILISAIPSIVILKVRVLLDSVSASVVVTDSPQIAKVSMSQMEKTHLS